MTLSEQSAALRRRLYDNRHWLPLLLYPAALLALLIARPFNIIPDSFVFTLLCAVISLSGVAVRVLTVGYLPRKSEEEVESGVHSTTLIIPGHVLDRPPSHCAGQPAGLVRHTSTWA